eukprot:216499_1
MAPHFLSLFVGISTLYCINSEIITCDGDCACSSQARHAGLTCILDCGGIDRCKGHTLTCRAGDPCEIHCNGKATCSSGTIINAGTATDVSILCAAEDACKSAIDITCGTGHCYLECHDSTSCENWGDLDPSRSQSFKCLGQCPSAVPAPFVRTSSPSQPPTIPTPRPTSIPTRMTTNPTTAIPTRSTTSSPTTNPTNTPTISPTKRPTQSPTNRPTFTTNVPTKTPIEPHTTFTTLHQTYPSNQKTQIPSTSSSSIRVSTEEPTANTGLQTDAMDDSHIIQYHHALSVPSAVIIILSIALCCVFMITLWAYVLHSKGQEGLGEPDIADIDTSYKPNVRSKSASIVSPRIPSSILSVGFNSNDTKSPLSSVYKTKGVFPGDEGSSDASSSDDLYRKLTQNVENEVQCTGQSSLSVIQRHISNVSINAPYTYAPHQMVMHSSPYSYAPMASISPGTPVYVARDYSVAHSVAHGHFPSLSLRSSIPWNVYYVPGSQFQPVGFPHIAGEDGSGVNELPSIPPGSVRDDDEFSHATVTSKELNATLQNRDGNVTLDIKESQGKEDDVVCAPIVDANTAQTCISIDVV